MRRGEQWWCIAVCCSVLQCVAVCCSVRSVTVPNVAVRSCVLQRHCSDKCCSVMRCVAVCQSAEDMRAMSSVIVNTTQSQMQSRTS